MKKLTLVGMFQSVSKKGDAFAIAYFTGDPDDKIKDKLKVNFVHVKAHTGIPGNEAADRMAKAEVGIE